MRDFTLNNDLRKEDIYDIKFTQCDNGSILKLNMFEDGQSLDLSNCSVVANFMRADGEIYTRDATVEGNTISVVLDSTVTAIEGILNIGFKIKYSNNTKQVSTFMIQAMVKVAIGEGNTGSIGGNTSGSTTVVTVDLLKVTLSLVDNTASCDKSFTEILNAIQANKLVIFEYNKKLHNYYFVNSTNTAITVDFINVSNKVTDIKFQIKEDTILSYTTESQITTIDDTTTSENTTWSSSKLSQQLQSIVAPTQEQINTAINNAIENGTLTGVSSVWSITSITLLESLLSKISYVDGATGQALATSLIAELRTPTTGGGTVTPDPPSVNNYSITYSLNGATSSNTANQVEENTSYTTTLSTSVGQIGTVTVLMGDNNITSTSYNEDTKTINIESVTGNIIITVTVLQSDNMINFSTCVDNISMPNGANVTPGTYLVTDFIEVEPSTTYKTNLTRYIDETNVNWGQQIYTFDIDKTYKSANQITDGKPFNTIRDWGSVEDVKFIRILFHINYRDIAYFCLSGVM